MQAVNAQALSPGCQLHYLLVDRCDLESPQAKITPKMTKAKTIMVNRTAFSIGIFVLLDPKKLD
jgi:hypothetical protein